MDTTNADSLAFDSSAKCDICILLFDCCASIIVVFVFVIFAVSSDVPTLLFLCKSLSSDVVVENVGWLQHCRGSEVVLLSLL